MSQFAGRRLRVKRAGEYIASVRSKSVNAAASAIDITNDDDDGWRKFLNEPGVRTVDVPVEGVFNPALHQSLLVELFEGPWIQADTIEINVVNGVATGGTLTGDFRLNSVSFTGPTSEAASFSAELQSSGEITYTPPA